METKHMTALIVAPEAEEELETLSFAFEEEGSLVSSGTCFCLMMGFGTKSEDTGAAFFALNKLDMFICTSLPTR